MTASRTRIEMATQRCRAVVLHGAECFELLKAEARSISLEKDGGFSGANLERPALKRLLITLQDGVRIEYKLPVPNRGGFN